MIPLFRAAGAVVLACVLVGVIGLGISRFFFPLTLFKIEPDKGQHVFRKHCASCHSLDSTQRYGPSLKDIGLVGNERVEGMDAEEYIVLSILQPSEHNFGDGAAIMPEGIANDMSVAEILNVTAFLCGQGGSAKYDRLMQFRQKIAAMKQTSSRSEQNLQISSIEKGQSLFTDKFQCNQCHSLDPYPGHELLAPSLHAIGTHDRSYLKESILEPNKRIVPGYETHLVMWNGRPVLGKLLPTNDAKLVRLLHIDSNGVPNVKTFQKAELMPVNGNFVAKSKISRMPPYKENMSAPELEAILDFLSTLRN